MGTRYQCIGDVRGRGLFVGIDLVKVITMYQSIGEVKDRSPFVRKIIKELSLTAKIQNKRIEKPPKSHHDIIVSRALAPLVKLLTYARMYSNKNTTSLFLKGRNATSEIDIASKVYFFEFYGRAEGF